MKDMHDTDGPCPGTPADAGPAGAGPAGTGPARTLAARAEEARADLLAHPDRYGLTPADCAAIAAQDAVPFTLCPPSAGALSGAQASPEGAPVWTWNGKTVRRMAGPIARERADLTPVQNHLRGLVLDGVPLIAIARACNVGQLWAHNEIRRQGLVAEYANALARNKYQRAALDTPDAPDAVRAIVRSLIDGPRRPAHIIEGGD